jgi:hypothetical protein
LPKSDLAKTVHFGNINFLKNFEAKKKKTFEKGQRQLTIHAMPCRTKIPRKQRSIYLGTIGAAARAENKSGANNPEGLDDEVEVSGHIDLDTRMKTENIMPYLNSDRKMVPRKSDLTYYNWDRGTLSLSIIDNFAIFWVIELSVFVAKIIDNSR